MAVPRCTGSKEPVRRPIDPVGGHRPHQSLGLGAPTEVDELVSASGAIMTPQAELADGKQAYPSNDSAQLRLRFDDAMYSAMLARGPANGNGVRRS